MISAGFRGARYVQSARQFLLLLHMDPPKIGSDPDLARPGPIQARLTHSGLIFGLFWVRFGSFLDRLGSPSANATANDHANACANANCNWNADANRH